MSELSIYNAGESDYDAIVTMNEAEVQNTSPMNVDRLRTLDAMASYHKVARIGDDVGAFILAFAENSAYESENYRWFASRYSKFLYVDRIVVDKRFSGLGIGSALYRDLFDSARSSLIPVVTCEINLVPENNVSHAFHQKFGFKEVGTQWLNNDTKKVSLQVLMLEGQP